MLIDCYNIEKFVKTIDTLIDNRNQSLTLKQNARNTIISSYNLKTLLPKHIELLKNQAEEKSYPIGQ